jgi:hypothetical protein
MSADTTPTNDTKQPELPSIGVDDAPLERDSSIRADWPALIVYDERIDDAWIQSDDWVETLLMA